MHESQRLKGGKGYFRYLFMILLEDLEDSLNVGRKVDIPVFGFGVILGYLLTKHDSVD